RKRLRVRAWRLRAGPAIAPLACSRRGLFQHRHPHRYRHGDRLMARTHAPQLAVAAVSGLLFGAGLYVSQMVDPLKVLRFLDFTAIPSGGWDPSLAFVIVPAIVVMFVAVRLGRSR